MSTPHINAAADAFAATVLLPGDPLRAQHIAERFLTNPVQVNTVRNMYGYTGSYRGQRISVMGSGMGIPSSSIYATELIQHYGVQRIVRVGTCGAVHDGLQLGDLVLALSASTDSNVNRMRFAGMDFGAGASYPLLRAVADQAQRADVPMHIGNVFSTDLFYSPNKSITDTLAAMGVLAVEMEAAGLYGLAAELGAQALAVLTVSDDLLHDIHMDAAQRQTGVDAMTELTLDALCG
ncbi:MAG: purine-nucleoside phosphorylase [Xanthomonadaceae bacterium]|nr:purine-nucleoside phosphorylase [Xanthomonadaceae bacterium]MDZ4115560.1 purine-nucleoside phosphorylase [Xanthomonadaceae bacterium]MDZ4379621.1 purine-nucleoside phosphorylase [Xanthomonadaceae bacterium]